MHKYFKNSLVTASSVLLMVSLNACGGSAAAESTEKDSQEIKDTVVQEDTIQNQTPQGSPQLPFSQTVQTAFDNFREPLKTTSKVA
jgi:hypothetical protein